MEFGRRPRFLTLLTVTAIGVGACTAVEPHEITGSKTIRVEAGTEVYDTDNGPEGACGKVAETGDYIADHETYGEQAFGTWNHRVAFAEGALPLEPNDDCDGDFQYVQGGQASPVPLVSTPPVSTPQ